MRPSEHKAAVITLAIATCIIIVTAALIQTNARVLDRLTSSRVRFAALETQKQSTRPKINRFRVAQNTCTSQNGLKQCSCPFYSTCCSLATFCFCTRGDEDCADD